MNIYIYEYIEINIYCVLCLYCIIVIYPWSIIIMYIYISSIITFFSYKMIDVITDRILCVSISQGDRPQPAARPKA